VVTVPWDGRDPSDTLMQSNVMLQCHGEADGWYGVWGWRVRAQEVGFFDVPSNSPGALASQLSADAALVQATTGEWHASVSVTCTTLTRCPAEVPSRSERFVLLQAFGSV
jgi:hypothetical protein